MRALGEHFSIGDKILHSGETFRVIALEPEERVLVCMDRKNRVRRFPEKMEFDCVRNVMFREPQPIEEISVMQKEGM